MSVKQLALAVAVATTDEILRINTASAKTMAVELKNSGANALDAFQMLGKVSPLSNDQLLSSISTDFTNAVYPILKASASPVTLAAGSTVWFVVDVTGFDSISFKASSAAGTTTCDIYASTKDLR